MKKKITPQRALLVIAILGIITLVIIQPDALSITGSSECDVPVTDSGTPITTYQEFNELNNIDLTVEELNQAGVYEQDGRIYETGECLEELEQ